MCLQMCLLFLLFFLEGNWKHYIQEVSSKLYTLLWKIFSHIIFRKVNAELIFTWKVHSSQTPHYKFYFFSPSREQRHSILIYCTFFPPKLTTAFKYFLPSGLCFCFCDLPSTQQGRNNLLWCGGTFLRSDRGSAVHTEAHDYRRGSAPHSCQHTSQKYQISNLSLPAVLCISKKLDIHTHIAT